MSKIKKILFMDDEEYIGKLAKDMLKLVDISVECVRDGEEAIKQYKSAQETGEPFNMAIFDLNIMGGMGGEETLQRIRKIDPKIKVVATSGDMDDENSKEYTTMGFSGHIAKPFKFSELKNLIDNM